MTTDEALSKALQTFKFKYVGGGYFRDQTIPKGETAEIIHGGHILTEFVHYVRCLEAGTVCLTCYKYVPGAARNTNEMCKCNPLLSDEKR